MVFLERAGPVFLSSSYFVSFDPFLSEENLEGRHKFTKFFTEKRARLTGPEPNIEDVMKR